MIRTDSNAIRWGLVTFAGVLLGGIVGATLPTIPVAIAAVCVLAIGYAMIGAMVIASEY